MSIKWNSHCSSSLLVFMFYVKCFMTEANATQCLWVMEIWITNQSNHTIHNCSSWYYPNKTFTCYLFGRHFILLQFNKFYISCMKVNIWLLSHLLLYYNGMLNIPWFVNVYVVVLLEKNCYIQFSINHMCIYSIDAFLNHCYCVSLLRYDFHYALKCNWITVYSTVIISLYRKVV